MSRQVGRDFEVDQGFGMLAEPPGRGVPKICAQGCLILHPRTHSSLHSIPFLAAGGLLLLALIAVNGSLRRCLDVATAAPLAAAAAAVALPSRAQPCELLCHLGLPLAVSEAPEAKPPLAF